MLNCTSGYMDRICCAAERHVSPGQAVYLHLVVVDQEHNRTTEPFARTQTSLTDHVWGAMAVADPVALPQGSPCSVQHKI